MIIDLLENATRYHGIHERIVAAFDYLLNTGTEELTPGKHVVDGDNLFAIVQEYMTIDTAGEQMECHKKYIDVQYMISGEELVGHALFNDQTLSKPYDPESDFTLFADEPSFFTKMTAGTFMVFFPTDLHMPCIKVGQPMMVKKVVVKVKV